MSRFVCIHAHFYQPPRENPWLEAIEKQDGAHPYHDWNERIAAECYAPNAGARILDPEKRIRKIISNYSRISFNFGPTLLQWMQEKLPDLYARVLEADQESRHRFSGHGSAISQVYNHLIMPLANRRDKRTQVVWGIRDFEHRFGRKPEGMWLPEAAVDMDSLDVLAEHGIQFTILAPHQAVRQRSPGKRSWQECLSTPIDPTRAYSVRLHSGKRIAVFFYDNLIARGVAFEGLLHRGEDLVNRILGAFSPSRDHPQLSHFATDGESYGHHHKHGEMALAYALDRIESGADAVLTNYGEFLDKHGPAHEVQIAENTSWSCAHGVERWRSNCGCRAGRGTSWSQEWRKPLRETLDWLRDALAPLFEEHAGALLRDAWAARDDYISVILDRSPENIEAFFARHSVRPLEDFSAVTALKLLEMQRQAMLMFTSCGWFFDDLAGIETVQILRHAGRALELAAEVFGGDLEGDFLRRLETARSNETATGNGRGVFEREVRPAKAGLGTIGAHFAVSSLFHENRSQEKIFCYTVEREDQRRLSEGKSRLFLGRATVRSDITWESRRITYGVLHLGDHNVSGGIRDFLSEEDYQGTARELSAVFRQGELAATVRAIEKIFDGGESALQKLLPDEQDRVLRVLLQSTMSDAEAAYRRFYEDHALLFRFVAALGRPLPQPIRVAAECLLNLDLGRICSEAEPDRHEIEDLLQEAERAGVRLDLAPVEEALRRTMESRGLAWVDQPDSLSRLRQFLASVELATLPRFAVDLWQVQNYYYRTLSVPAERLRRKAGEGDRRAAEWVRLHLALGRRLNFRVED